MRVIPYSGGARICHVRMPARRCAAAAHGVTRSALRRYGPHQRVTQCKNGRSAMWCCQWCAECGAEPPQTSFCLTIDLGATRMECCLPKSCCPGNWWDRSNRCPTPAEPNVDAHRIFTANFKRSHATHPSHRSRGRWHGWDIIMDICALNVENALPWCACLTLGAISTTVESVGGFNLLFLDSFGSFETGVEPVLRVMLRMRLLALGSTTAKTGKRAREEPTERDSKVFLCFASSHRGECDSKSWSRRVLLGLRRLLREFGHTDVTVEPHSLLPSQMRPYHSMLFHAFWLVRGGHTNRCDTPRKQQR